MRPLIYLTSAQSYLAGILRHIAYESADPDIRFLSHQGHFIFFRHADARAEIVNVLHWPTGRRTPLRRRLGCCTADDRMAPAKAPVIAIPSKFTGSALTASSNA